VRKLNNIPESEQHFGTGTGDIQHCTDTSDIEKGSKKRRRRRLRTRNMQGNYLQSFSPAWRSSLTALLLLLLAILPVCTTTDEHTEEETEPAQAVLFPWFAQALGIVTFYILSRFAPWLPYTGVLFLLGTIAGIGTVRLMNDHDLAISMNDFWIPINSEVLLLIFLPGLVFKDAASLSIHLFQKSIGQCLIFAFPMVLAGTVLTALTAFYVFPYDWSFNLCMTFGSILSATDPVAVSALLEVTGAPVRLKMPIAGESLLNDGAAIVFFTIFSNLYLTELDMLPEIGEEIDWPAGIKLFIRMAVGGVAAGILFGIVLLTVLRLFTHNLNRNENVVEVASTITTAYLCYYTSDVVWGVSGVIATVTLGLIISYGGRPLINDVGLLEDFWMLVEHLLNTLLFMLGGLVWGTIIANQGDRTGTFTGKDWGYLVLLYIILTAIRFALFAICFPVISRIGLKSNWQEMVFQSFSGLRGAIGISLAIFLDNEVRQATDGQNKVFELQTNKLFGFVGGIAFMTLLINATTAGPLLRKLGLADSSQQREQVVQCIRGRWRDQAVQDLIGLLTQQRFRRVNFATVRHHVFMLKDMSRNELLEAVDTYHNNFKHLPNYRAPKLENILPYVEDEEDGDYDGQDFSPTIQLVAEHRRSSMVTSSIVANAAAKFHARASRRSGVHATHETVLSTIELRHLFLDLLKSLYEHQIDSGELFERQFVALALQQSVDFAADAVSKGEVLRDWEFTRVINLPAGTLVRQITNLPLVKWVIKDEHVAHNLKYEGMRVDVERSLAFLHAHAKAQEVFQREFVGSKFSTAERTVIEESMSERRLAQECLDKYPAKDVEIVVSHKFCSILLNKGARYIENLNRTGLLKNREAEEVLEKIQNALQHVTSCSLEDHPGEIPMTDDDDSYKDDNDSCKLEGFDEEEVPESTVNGNDGGVSDGDLKNK
jgi:NhaP-type Na+/H+ or K+/H+ antiporter